MQSRSRLVAALIAALAGAGGLLVAAMPVRAAGCSVMSFQFDAPTGGVVLSPQRITVAAGACVTFHNGTITSADFSVGGRYKQSAAAFSDATPSYIAGPAGTTQPVTASGAAGSAHGSIVVKPAVKPARSPSPSRSRSPAPQRSPSSSPTPSRAPSPPATHTSSPPPVQPVQPGTSPTPDNSSFLAGQPTPTPSPSQSQTVVSGPLQPPTGRGTGLPAALAALAVVGTAAALLRVLLAEPVGPVDDGRRPVGAAL